MTPLLAEAFPPGDYLASELEERHWSQNDFAQIIGRPAQFVSEIIAGKKEITRESAAQIGAALGTSPEIWLNLQNNYLLWQQNQDDSTKRELDEVKVRARLNELAPIAVLQKRGLLESSTLQDLEEEVKDLFQIDDISEEPSFLAAARRANADEALTPTQKAWLACARRKALVMQVERYDQSALKKLAARIPRVAATAEGFADLPELFARAGVRLVYIEALPSSKIGGATFLLDEDPDSPVIALSGRGQRLDIVLFTLLHEVAHLLRGDVKPGDMILDEENGDTLGDEAATDKMAGDWILPDDLPVPSAAIRRRWVDQVAKAHGVHPIVVIGRLQKQGQLDWRTSLVKGAPPVTAQLENW